MNIVEFIEARIAEDEQIARKADAAQDDPLYPGTKMGLWVVTDSDFAIGVDYDPARVLRQCKALRDAVATVQDLLEEGWSEDDAAYMRIRALSSMAAIWSDHPDYQQEWESQ
ncbi:DUF6221 family protein [Rhodococcus zopfii]